MTFSLLNVYESSGNLVSGNWIQDHIGTLESAAKRARETEAVNGGQITVAVVPKIESTVAALAYWKDQKRLDLPKPSKK